MIYLPYFSNKNTYLLRNMYSEEKERNAKKLKYPILFQISRGSKTIHEGENNKLEEYYFIQCTRMLNYSTNVESLFGQWHRDDWFYFLHYKSNLSQYYGNTSNFMNIIGRCIKQPLLQ